MAEAEQCSWPREHEGQQRSWEVGGFLGVRRSRKRSRGLNKDETLGFLLEMLGSQGRISAGK